MGVDVIRQVYTPGFFRRRRLGEQADGSDRFVGAGILVVSVAIVAIFTAVSSIPGGGGLLGPLLLVAIVVAMLLMLAVSRTRFRDRQHEPGCCEECGYPLSALTEPRCPECGTPFDPEWVADEIELAEEQADDA